MKLSVVLPCFNGAKTIAVQLEALTTQHWPEGWEVVVVNNGSTDESMAIVEQYRNRLSGLRIVEAYNPAEGRLGVAHSYTVGMKAATGDAFVFCEADDEVGAGWLQAMGEALKQHDFVAASMEYMRLNEAWLAGDGRFMQAPDQGLPSKAPLFLPFASGCTFGLKRSVYETVGDPDPACLADWDTDYCWRANHAGIQLHFHPEAVVHYRLRAKLIDRYYQARNWGEASVVTWKKHGPHRGWFALLKYLIRRILNIFKDSLKLVFTLYDKKRFSDRVGALAWQVGELQGIFKYLVLPGFRRDRAGLTIQELKGV
ncbi:glycosyltransferase family 2 protein [Leptolyngbya sp. NK1-12]|uniref:Glycosyltransferase family 2 protein n=1 Tax=Leptolyngbya sp. NK1-12 TaxID=2547451 RepID=A0AA97AHY2_9CYAN|nr:glycosyltransferase family A protein [Leptolyngbya sp. NK1-12]WNZ25019.1 glycosyltransferase family 2 protein [Leptolyngbya sp. NK1-12]